MTSTRKALRLCPQAFAPSRAAAPGRPLAGTHRLRLVHGDDVCPPEGVYCPGYQGEKNRIDSLTILKHELVWRLGS
jgi:hypothetical protein